MKRTCKVCGTLFEPRRNQIKRGVGHYCSQRCNGAAHAKELSERFWQFVMPGDIDECWVWTGAMISGYGQMRANGRAVVAHRLSYQLFNGPIPSDRPMILHSCDNRACVNPAHLEAGTHTQNMADAVARNRFKRGEDVPHAKLTGEQVQAIRRDPRRQHVIAESYGVSQMTVSRVKRGATWGHI